ncbi:hypothetical protein IMG5_187850 [Ichthyophthirius multifiliis]|uniref:Mitochondrial pyruvate carrier n=1 Tax=Ichthyophthirius multifiliis TaxID=5932 RepID=G0R3W4_ICHMU|nr:hypothetical protein IMG5_187850 [Ichthyophthirius multifiliis]EGR27840.1 hypothetical protein IMG5_187850 [Ichthyophthirius multifiliis]|eukprot:XP_004027185.1 hypothetical protein IMG5_187850 [Ichthyophthirius multifiliis]
MFGIVPLIQKRVLTWNFWPASMRQFLMHSAGPFTIFFWCPLIKWGITLVNFTDFNIPLEQVNTFQQLAIMLSGFTWTRYSFVINPVNYSLALVNFVMGLSGMYQLSRKIKGGKLLD